MGHIYKWEAYGNNITHFYLFTKHYLTCFNQCLQNIKISCNWWLTVTCWPYRIHSKIHIIRNLIIIKIYDWMSWWTALNGQINVFLVLKISFTPINQPEVLQPQIYSMDFYMYANSYYKYVPFHLGSLSLGWTV